MAIVSPGMLVRYEGTRSQTHGTVGIVIHVKNDLCHVLWTGGRFDKLYIQLLDVRSVTKVN